MKRVTKENPERRNRYVPTSEKGIVWYGANRMAVGVLEIEDESGAANWFRKKNDCIDRGEQI